MPEDPGSVQQIREFLPGELIDGKFRIVRKISAGSFGSVYEVIQLPFERSVALKLLNRSTLGNDKQIKRFRREAKAASSFQHPNLASVYEYGFLEEGPAYIAMQLVEGEPLSARTRRGGRFVAEDALKIFAQVASGLASAHLHEVIHRDIKPENLLLTADENGEVSIKLVDFGLASPTGDWAKHTQKLTQLGQTVGTPAYMSPEQCMAKTVDERSDIYSLGCTMYEAVSGEPPFAGASTLETMHQQIRAHPRELHISSADPNTAQRLADIIYKCMQKKPTARYANAAELLTDIETVTSGGVPVASKDSSVRPSRAQEAAIDLTSRLRRLNPLLAASIFLCALVLLSVGTALVLRSLHSDALTSTEYWQDDLLAKLDNRPGINVIFDGRRKHFALSRKPLPLSIDGVFLIVTPKGKYAATYKEGRFETPLELPNTAHTLAYTPDAIYIGEEDTIREMAPNILFANGNSSAKTQQTIEYLGMLGTLSLDPKTKRIAASGWISATRGSLIGASVAILDNNEFQPAHYMKIESTHMYENVTFGPDDSLWSWVERPDGSVFYSEPRRDDSHLIEITSWDFRKANANDASMWDRNLRSKVAFAAKRLTLPCKCQQMRFATSGELWITTGAELWCVDLKNTQITIYSLPKDIEVIDLQLSTLPSMLHPAKLTFTNTQALA